MSPYEQLYKLLEAFGIDMTATWCGDSKKTPPSIANGYRTYNLAQELQYVVKNIRAESYNAGVNDTIARVKRGEIM